MSHLLAREPHSFGLVVPIDLSGLSRKDMDYRRRVVLSESLRREAVLTWIQAGRPKASWPVRVSLYAVQRRVMDDEGLMLALKPIRDSLFAARRAKKPLAGLNPKTGKPRFTYDCEPGLITDDDDPEHLLTTVAEIRKCRPGENPYVRFEIDPRPVSSNHSVEGGGRDAGNDSHDDRSARRAGGRGRRQPIPA